MSDDVISTDIKHQSEQRVEHQDLEFWKHFAGMGGTDKNTMITTVSWLLAFAAAAIGYIVTNPDMIASSSPRLPHPGRMMVVSLLGLLVSGVAGYLTLLYGGYANRNWAKADQLALKHGLRHLLPDESSVKKKEGNRDEPGRLAAVAWRLARPCDPVSKLAPVFTIFASLSLLAGLVHFLFLAWSCETLFFR